MPKSLLIRNAVLDGAQVDILLENGVFARIAPKIEAPNSALFDAAGNIIVPPFYNCHTHAAMTLLRGYADDKELFDWLQNYIWPAEVNLTAELVYHGTRLAILEMIRSGTIFFNDMYWHPAAALRAVEEMGVRAALGRLFIEERPGKIKERNLIDNRELEAAYAASTARQSLILTHAPHAVYTVSGESLRQIAEKARANDDYIHIHAAETQKEVNDCLAATGKTPIAWLDACGILGSKTVLAHCVHLTAADIAIIRDRGATVIHMPVSNAKLASGCFDYRKTVSEGKCRFTIGTDGCASNNSLSMFGEIKVASLLAKLVAGDATCGRDVDIWAAATATGPRVFGYNGGAIAEGAVADAVLLDKNSPLLTPQHRCVANLVYAADSSCVDTVICDGQIIMRHRQIAGEAEILAAARESAVKMARE